MRPLLAALANVADMADLDSLAHSVANPIRPRMVISAHGSQVVIVVLGAIMAVQPS